MVKRSTMHTHVSTHKHPELPRSSMLQPVGAPHDFNMQFHFRTATTEYPLPDYVTIQQQHLRVTKAR